MARREVGSWLEGPSSARPTGQPRGVRLGLPESGPGSVAPWGPRIAALVVDWVASLLVTRLLFRELRYGSPAYSLAVLVVFGVSTAVLHWLVGASLGQRLLRLSVVRLDGRPLGLVRSLLRALLLCLAVPALIWDRDGRGLHDKAVGSVVVRAR